MPARKRPHPEAAARRIPPGPRSRGRLTPLPTADHQAATTSSTPPPMRTRMSPVVTLCMTGASTPFSFPFPASGWIGPGGRVVPELRPPLGPEPLQGLAHRQAALAGDAADLVELRRHRDRLPVESGHLEGEGPQGRGEADHLPREPGPRVLVPAHPDGRRLAEEERRQLSDPL